MIKVIQKVWQRWESFWWAPIDGRSLQYSRIVFGFSALLITGMKFWQLDLYNEKALAPRDEALDLLQSMVRPLWSWNFWPDHWAPYMLSLLMVLLFLFTLGWTRRPLIFLAWVLHLGFMQRNYAASMGVDSMMMVFLFYFSFVEVWKKENHDALSRLMIRMTQVHLAIIYYYTGIEKLRGTTWWEGSALWLVFNNTQITLWDLTWMAHFPFLLALLAHVTVVWEIFFPAAIINPRTKYLWLLMGFGFHVGIALVLDLWGFSALMLSQYFLYIRTDEWERLKRFLMNPRAVLS